MRCNRYTAYDQWFCMGSDYGGSYCQAQGSGSFGYGRCGGNVGVSVVTYGV